jgi:DNA helicase II / ATP-dependent DNA helicase PcrA
VADPEIHITGERKELLDSDGHLLVLGGPGSGKTTIAVLKAAHDLASEQLDSGQKALFLSFARATVSRVVQEAEARVPRVLRERLEMSTYHGFEWKLIQTYGYLATGRKTLRILTPPEVATRSAGIPSEDRAKHLRVLRSQGLLGFDLFAEMAAELLEGSPRLRSLISDFYPLVILDEFQDTNLDEWMAKAVP